MRMRHPQFSIKWRLVPFECVAEIAREIASRLREGSLDAALYRDYSASITCQPPEKMPEPKSVAVVAVRQPSLTVRFRRGAKEFAVTVPPTYYDAAEVDSLAARELKRAFGDSHTFIRAYLPFKLLACRAGLAYYGRNNIAYVPGWGSFLRLTAFYADVGARDYTWQEPKVLPECEGCRLCIDACPAKVMSGTGFMANAEHCLTYHNEKQADAPFPDWVKPSWHNALVGCMICQRVCPANRGVIGWTEDRGEFSEEETEYLLGGDFSDRAEAERVEEKLRAVGLDLSVFPRNLKALGRG